jgi:hypothetical protein
MQTGGFEIIVIIGLLLLLFVLYLILKPRFPEIKKGLIKVIVDTAEFFT